MTLAEKLAKVRKKKGLSMSQVARKSFEVSKDDHRGKITQGYISRLESGKETNPSMKKIISLSKIYKLKPGDLF